MKFKQIIKNNIKRISAVILCLIMIFSISITTYALEGEAGGLDKAILNEYNENASVFFNPQGLPVYSPFNKTVLYYLTKWPIVSDDLEFSTHEYVALTEYDGSTETYCTYYLIPERYTNNSFLDIWTNLFNGKTNFPNMYYDLFYNNAEISEDGNYANMNSSYSAVKFIDILTSELTSLSLGTSDFTDSMNGYLYSITRTESDTVVSVSEIYYGSYDKCFNYLPTSNICQIYYSSSYEISSFKEQPEAVSTKNLNYKVSVSTYSVTAYDYFDNTAAANGFMSESVSFTNKGLGYNGGGTPTYYVPDCIRGPNYPEGASGLSAVSTDDNYYLKDGYLTSERSYLFIPTWSGSSSVCYMNCIVFPEEVETPILYFKFCKGYSGKYTYLQLLSKVDYDFYYGGTLIGSFDAETTTFSCVATARFSSSTSGYSLYHTLTTNYNNNSNAIVSTADYTVYPYLAYGSNAYSASTFSLRHIYGNDMVFSIFPDNSDTLGFYTYISPSIAEEVDKGNTGTVGGNIFDNIGGNNNPEDPWHIDETIFIDYPEDSIIGGFLPDFPDFSDLLDIDGADIWLLPERVSEKMVECIMWVSDAFNLFIEKYDGPISKIFLIAALILEYIPDYLKFLFIFALCCSLAFKMLQYTQSSAFVIGSMVGSSNSSIGSNHGMEKEEKNKTKKGGGE